MTLVRVGMRYVALGGLVAVLSGCAIKRDEYVTPDVPLPETFMRDPAAVAVSPETTAAQEEHLRETLPRWWEAYGSAELNALVDRALEGNADLRMAVLRVTQAEAGLTQEEAAQYPSLDATASAGADAPYDGIGTVDDGDDPISERTYQAGLEATWTPDIWGEHAAAADSAAADLRAALFERDRIRASTVNQVVNAYLRYLSLKDRIATARDVTRTMVESLESLRARLRDNDTTALRVAQQESLAYASIATIPDLELQRDRAHDELAFLVGTIPGDLALEGTSLADLSLPVAPTGLPPVLVLNRPEVREVEARLLGADADIDVARARILPPLTLRAGYGYGANYLSRLFTPESIVWDVLASLTANIFDAGQRSAAIDESRARHAELTEAYVQSVYQGIRDVEDSLSAQSHLARRVAAQETSVKASEAAYKLSRQSHEFGSVDYLTVLDAERTYLRSLDDLHRIRLDRHAAMADFFTALGGGATALPKDKAEDEGQGEAAGDGKSVPASASEADTAEDTTPASAGGTPPLNKLELTSIPAT